MVKSIDEMSADEVLYRIAILPVKVQSEIFKTLDEAGTFTEDEIWNMELSVSALRLMMNQDIKEAMGDTLYEYFTNQKEENK